MAAFAVGAAVADAFTGRANAGALLRADVDTVRARLYVEQAVALALFLFTHLDAGALFTQLIAQRVLPLAGDADLRVAVFTGRGLLFAQVTDTVGAPKCAAGLRTLPVAVRVARFGHVAIAATLVGCAFVRAGAAVARSSAGRGPGAAFAGAAFRAAAGTTLRAARTGVDSAASFAVPPTSRAGIAAARTLTEGPLWCATARVEPRRDCNPDQPTMERHDLGVPEAPPYVNARPGATRCILPAVRSIHAQF